MRILITGGTGLIGKALCSALIDRGHEVFVLSRTPKRAREILPSAISTLSYTDNLPSFEIIVNLAGASISKRFLTEKRLLQIEKSRLDLIDYLYFAKRNDPPALFIQASAITMDDSCFSKICSKVEKKASKRFAMTKVANVRFATVLSPKGGLLYYLSYLPKLNFLNGMNYVPFITLYDCISALEIVIEKQLTDVVDICSDYQLNLQNLILHYQKSKILNIFSLPLIKELLLLDKRGSLLLIDKKIKPKKLIENSMNFTNLI